MNRNEYRQSKQALARDVAEVVDARLRNSGVKPHTTFRFQDETRNERYLLTTYYSGWRVAVQGWDGIDDRRHLLGLHSVIGRVGVDGRRRLFGVMGRIIHIETVPNEHTLEMIRQLLKQLPAN